MFISSALSQYRILAESVPMEFCIACSVSLALLDFAWYMCFSPEYMHLTTHASLRAVAIEASGPHFCIGGYPHGKHVEVPLANVAAGLLVVAQGCCMLRQMQASTVAAVHGLLAGGGIALCLNTAYACAHIYLSQISVSMFLMLSTIYHPSSRLLGMIC